MKIALVTTLPSLVENKRIEEETNALGHKFKLVNMQEFGFRIEHGNLIVEQFKSLDANVVIVRGVFLAIKTISEIVKSLRKKGTKIFDNNFLEHRYSIDKVTDLVKLSIGKVPVPDTLYSRNFLDYPGLAEKLGYPFVIKSSRMGKGANVFKIESQKALTAFITAFKKTPDFQSGDELNADVSSSFRGNPAFQSGEDVISDAENEGKSAKSYLLQAFIPYVYDLRALIIGKHVFTMRRIPAKGEFRANFSLGGRVEPFDLDEEGKKLAVTALDAVDMSVGGVDILITKDNKRYVLEVNHTAGFVGMEKATGENIAKVYVEHAISNAK